MSTVKDSVHISEEDVHRISEEALVEAHQKIDISQRALLKWTLYLAVGLECVLQAKTIAEAREIARERLRKLTEKTGDFKHVSDETRLRWLLAVHRKDPHDNE